MNSKNNDFEKKENLQPDEISETSVEDELDMEAKNDDLDIDKPGFLNLNPDESSDFFLNQDEQPFSLWGDRLELDGTSDFSDSDFKSDSEDFSHDQTLYISPVKKRKKRTLGTRGFVAILCVICACIGGVFGAFSAIGYDRFLKPETSKQEQDGLQGQSNLSLNDGITLPDDEQETLAGVEGLPLEPSTEESNSSTVMTPNSLSASEIYANSVDSVVGISGTMLINNGIWGQSKAQVAGSGFIISENGYIVTNAHVVNGVDDLSVTLYNGEKYSAEVVGMEISNDIAVIKISKTGLKATVWGDSDSLVVGEELLIIGNPLGELTHTLTNGVVSALSRRIESENDVMNMFQTNAAINSGNSGGPVFDMKGKVVGIATSKYASSSLEGLSFCIPVNDVKSYIDDIIAYGYVKNRPLLGISVQTVTNSIASRYNIVLGAYVVAVGEGSGAALAGLSPSDVIVELDGQPISSVADLQGVLKTLKSGLNVPISVYRQGQRIDLSIRLGEKVPANARTNYTNVYDL